jgi:hypothetical protein
MKINKYKTIIMFLWIVNEFIRNMDVSKTRNKSDAKLIKITLLTPKYPNITLVYWIDWFQ